MTKIEVTIRWGANKAAKVIRTKSTSTKSKIATRKAFLQTNANQKMNSKRAAKTVSVVFRDDRISQTSKSETALYKRQKKIEYFLILLNI